MSKSIINQNNTYCTIDDFNLHEGFGNKDGSLKVKFGLSEKHTKIPHGFDKSADLIS